MISLWLEFFIFFQSGWLFYDGLHYEQGLDVGMILVGNLYDSFLSKAYINLNMNFNILSKWLNNKHTQQNLSHKHGVEKKNGVRSYVAIDCYQRPSYFLQDIFKTSFLWRFSLVYLLDLQTILNISFSNILNPASARWE